MVRYNKPPNYPKTIKEAAKWMTGFTSDLVICFWKVALPFVLIGQKVTFGNLGLCPYIYKRLLHEMYALYAKSNY